MAVRVEASRKEDKKGNETVRETERFAAMPGNT